MFDIVDVGFYTLSLAMAIVSPIILVIYFLIEKCELARKVMTFISGLFSLVTFAVLTFYIIYYNYAIPYYERQAKIEYRDSYLSRLSKGELDCNLIYTDANIYFELAQEEQLQYYTKCKVIQESK